MEVDDRRSGSLGVLLSLAIAGALLSGCGDDNVTPVVSDDGVQILTAGDGADSAMSALGTFVLRHDQDLNCLYHDEEDNNGEPGTGGRVVIMWPPGYTAKAAGDGVVVFAEDGEPVAETDVAFQIGGGAAPASGDHCDAIGTWIANGPPIERSSTG